MVTFRNNNNRRSSFRNNNRRTSFRRNDEASKYSSNENFQRKAPGRNNHNASKLIEKYTDLAREALAHEDKILSENYFQHADHFTRVLNEQEKHRVNKVNNVQTEVVTPIKPDNETSLSNPKDDTNDKKADKPIEKKTASS